MINGYNLSCNLMLYFVKFPKKKKILPNMVFEHMNERLYEVNDTPKCVYVLLEIWEILFFIIV